MARAEERECSSEEESSGAEEELDQAFSSCISRSVSGFRRAVCDALCGWRRLSNLLNVPKAGDEPPEAPGRPAGPKRDGARSHGAHQRMLRAGEILTNGSL